MSREALQESLSAVMDNEADELEYKRPSDETVERFQNVLVEHNVSAFVRKNRGNDISAACGQLMKKWA